MKKPGPKYRERVVSSLLDGAIDQMKRSTERANAALDVALAFIDASNARIDAMEEDATMKIDEHHE